MAKIDNITEQFIADALEREHRRLIAALLNELEAYFGGKDEKMSTMIKNVANQSKRIMFTQLTKTEVESKYAGGG